LQGKKRDVIAGELRVSVRTVRFHVENLHRKTGCQCGLLLGFWAASHPALFASYTKRPSMSHDEARKMNRKH
jgi:hypothetical protein